MTKIHPLIDEMEIGGFLAALMGKLRMILAHQEVQEALMAETILVLLPGKLLAGARYRSVSLNEDYSVPLCLQFEYGARITSI